MRKPDVKTRLKTQIGNPYDATECVKDLDKRSKRIIFRSILTIFELSSIFGGRWGSIENWLKPKTEPPLDNLACPNP